MKIVVTGAAGFIGSSVVDLLIKQGYKAVYSVDNLSGGYIENVNPKSKFINLDLRDTEETAKIISKIAPDLLFHLAADAAEGRSQFVPLNCTDNNYKAYLNVLVPAIKHKVKKVVLVSSMSVYGGQQAPFSEDQYPQPEDIYGINKFSMEKSTEVLSNVFGFQYTIIRPHNVYGPRQNLADPYRNVVAIFINCLLQKRHFYIYGKGEQKRAFTYIDDCAPYIVKAGLAKKANSEIFNIGPEKYYSINELANAVLSIFFDGEVPDEYKPHYLDLRPQEVIEAYCTVDKAKKILGFNNKTTLEKGLKEMIKWAKKMGPQEFKYLKEFELENKKLPLSWKNKLI